jgi:hypothetical protein
MQMKKGSITQEPSMLNITSINIPTKDVTSNAISEDNDSYENKPFVSIDNTLNSNSVVGLDDSAE